MNWTEAFETLKNYDVPATEARLTLRRAKVLDVATYGNVTVTRTNAAEYAVYVA